MKTSDDEMLSTTSDDLVTKEILRPLQNETQGSFIFLFLSEIVRFIRQRLLV